MSEVFCDVSVSPGKFWESTLTEITVNSSHTLTSLSHKIILPVNIPVSRKVILMKENKMSCNVT
jgi:hypothetical protein